MKHITLFALGLLLIGSVARAQDHHHDHGHDHGSANGDQEPVERPRVFLDKNPRIVAYQLNRLTNDRLLLVERYTTDAKYAPVYMAILTRAGMSRQDRNEALDALMVLNKSDATSELLSAIEGLESEKRDQQRVARQLTTMLVQVPRQQLVQHQADLTRAATAEQPLLSTAGMAALISAGSADTAWKEAQSQDDRKLRYLGAISQVRDSSLRKSLRDSVVQCLGDDESPAVRRAAIQAIAAVPADGSANFLLIAPFIQDPKLRTPAVRTLLSIPQDNRSKEVSQQLIAQLVDQAEKTPADQRTTDQFVDAMQLADQLLAAVSVDEARVYRQRLREITVRVVRIHTVEEEMRYDIKYFAVEAERPVQILLQNEDLMPHNLVITAPGALREVAEAGAMLPPNYLPKTDKVLFATDMVQAGQQIRLTFNAPSQAGEYPFVCTFPRHWMRMYGVMVVVDDLDEWLQNPIEPTDPIGNTRSFVQNWTPEDFQSDLDANLRGRSAEIGALIFKQATCLQCHKIQGEGGAVGPDLADVLKRHKEDKLAVLREILDPSHKIDPKYAVRVIETGDGEILSGIVQAEDAQTVTIVTNPEAPKPVTVEKSDIEDMVKSSKSMMPKALLDQFTRDEVLELLAYVLSASQDAASQDAQ